MPIMIDRPKRKKVAAPVRVERRAYRLAEYCAAVGISRSMAYVMMADGRLPFFSIGRRRHIPADFVERQVRGELPEQRRAARTREPARQ
jgi:excisionase family DNA binding protein